MRKNSVEELPHLLPNETPNYVKSPAAIHALIDGSLDTSKGDLSRINHRKMRLKDSFAAVFPTYNHKTQVSLTGSQLSPTALRAFVYPEKNLLGAPMYEIDREHTRKRDAINDYAVGRAKVQSIMRIYKA